MPDDMTAAPLPTPADSHGAVDLSAPRAATTAPSAEGVGQSTQAEGLHIPLITSANEESFQDVVATSQALPVIIVLWSGRSLESKPMLATMEEMTRDNAGAFQLVNIDIDSSPQIAQAFQVQAIPSVVALVGGRPVPLFHGSAAKEQIQPIIQQILDAAAQMGATARIAVSQEDTAAPIPPEHEAPLAAEARGDMDEAIAGWEKIIELNPRDEAAKSHVARVRLAARAAHADDAADPAAHAEALFASGEVQGAFDTLLELIAGASDSEEKDALRLRLLDLFRVAGSVPEVKAARTRLAMLLM